MNDGDNNDKRIEKLRALMKKKLLTYLVTSPANLRYLTNFTGTAGLALITLKKRSLLLIFVTLNKRVNRCKE